MASTSLLTSAWRNGTASRPSNRSRPRGDLSTHPAPVVMMRYSESMLGTSGLARHLSVAVLSITTLAGTPAVAQKAPTDGAARFLVTVRGVRIGTEVVDVAHAANSIKITSSGQLAAPFDLTTTKFEMTYSADWQPVQLAIEGVLRGQ